MQCTVHRLSHDGSVLLRDDQLVGGGAWKHNKPSNARRFTVYQGPQGRQNRLHPAASNKSCANQQAGRQAGSNEVLTV